MSQTTASDEIGDSHNNLEQTGSKQANPYTQTSLKGAPFEFIDHVRNLIQDFTDQLNKLKYRAQLFNSYN